MSNKYNERVRNIAESMAKERHPKHWNQFISSSIDSAFWQQETESYINDFLPEARIAVAHMVEAVRNSFKTARNWVSISDEYIDKYLMQEGLIPDSEQEEIIVLAASDDRVGIHNPDNPQPDRKHEACPHELRCDTRNRHKVACECCNMGLLADKQQIKKCPEFPHFGASYPDARCVDGYLWDLDKCEDGKLYGGGDDPCPFCNTELYKEWCGWEDAREEKRYNILHHIDMLHKKYMPQQEGGKS